MAEALETLNNNLTPSVTQTTLGDTSLYPHGRPSYRLDPTVTDPVENIGLGGASGMNLAIGQGGAAAFQISYWRVNVQGQAPGGSVARIEVESGALLAN